MMTSFLDNIPTIVRASVDCKPNKILDIGAGFGKFGLLIKEALLSLQAEAGDMNPKPNFIIDACESAVYFLNQPAFASIYDNICPSDVRTLSREQLQEYDLLLLIDVVEHWPKEDYFNFIKKLAPGTRVLVSTPKEVVFYEEPYYGIEKHQTQFAESDFSGENLSTKDSLIFLFYV